MKKVVFTLALLTSLQFILESYSNVLLIYAFDYSARSEIFDIINKNDGTKITRFTEGVLWWLAMRFFLTSIFYVVYYFILFKLRVIRRTSTPEKLGWIHLISNVIASIIGFAFYDYNIKLFCIWFYSTFIVFVLFVGASNIIDMIKERHLMLRVTKGSNADNVVSENRT